MKVLLIPHTPLPEAWRAAFERVFKDEGLALWPDLKDAARVECAIVAKAELGALSNLPGLRLISSTGMGVDHILALPDLPADVPIARVVSRTMVDQVAEYVVLATLRAEREADYYDQLQRERRWQRRTAGRPGGRLAVGLLGFGATGREIARRLKFLGFPVQAWASAARVEDGISVRAGEAQFTELLRESDILVNVLPATRETIDLLDTGALSMLRRGAHLINVGRGEHVVDAALLEALDNGHLSGATLDVFRTEPLPPDHPFWSHHKIRVTPHSAGLLSPADSAEIILENLHRVRRGEQPRNLVRRQQGY